MPNCGEGYYDGLGQYKGEGGELGATEHLIAEERRKREEEALKEKIIKKFLSMINDDTGTVRRYAKSLKHGR